MVGVVGVVVMETIQTITLVVGTLDCLVLVVPLLLLLLPHHMVDTLLPLPLLLLLTEVTVVEDMVDTGKDMVHFPKVEDEEVEEEEEVGEEVGVEEGVEITTMLAMGVKVELMEVSTRSLATFFDVES